MWPTPSSDSPTGTICSDENVRLLHFNHTNPLLMPSPQRERVLRSALGIASDGDMWAL